MATFPEILGFVSDFNSIPEELIVSKVRIAPVAKARAQVAWLARQLTDLSYPEIGRRLHCVHSAIISMVQGVERNKAERDVCDSMREGLLEVDELMAESPPVEPVPVPPPPPIEQQSSPVTDYVVDTIRRRLTATWALKPGVGL